MIITNKKIIKIGLANVTLENYKIPKDLLILLNSKIVDTEYILNILRKE